MPTNRLTWDDVGKHFYETGVSKGALYLAQTNPTDGSAYYPQGVAWNGLTSVSESPDGGDAEDFYADNIKYLTLRGVESLTGSINAYTYPDEFMQCDGSVILGGIEGVYVHQQARKTFGMSYVTNVGNDVTEELGEIYHLLYGLTVSPSDREYSTVNDSPEPIEFSWDFSAQSVPVVLPSGVMLKNTSLITLDSRKLSPARKDLLEAHLWGREADSTAGTEAINAHLPLPTELFTLLNSVSG